MEDWVRSSLTAYYFGPSRAHDALFDVSLPRFIISNAALGLLASQFHFLGYVVDSLGPILFLIKAVARRSEVKLVRRGPLSFYFVGGLNTPCLWHDLRAPFRRIIFDWGFYTEDKQISKTSGNDFVPFVPFCG